MAGQPIVVEPESEFGKGFLYPLALFLAHAALLSKHVSDFKEMAKKNPGLFGPDSGSSMWFYAAADHLLDFNPEAAPAPLIQRSRDLYREAVAKRLPTGGEQHMTPERAAEFIDEVKTLFLDVDLHNGVDAVKAGWS